MTISSASPTPPVASDAAPACGLYIHVPFCQSRCIYCDFYSTTFGRDMQRAYVRALCREMAERGLGWALKLLAPMTGMVDKAFGSLCYDRALSDYPQNYCVRTFDESILETEGVSQ